MIARSTSHITPLRFMGRLVLAFVKLTLLLAELALLAALVGYQFYLRDVISNLPDPGAIGQRRLAEATRIYARDGETLLAELVDPQGGRRVVVPFERIPATLKHATIAVEDANFYQNPGVDLRGILRAVLLNYQSQTVVSGGSTITQQLVRNTLFDADERNRRSFERKLREVVLAYQVSQRYSKDQILGLYLNQTYYGNQSYGVEAAAQSYFGKHIDALNDAEATLIAGLPQSPTQLDPLSNFLGAKARQKIVLDLMTKYGYLSAQQAQAIYNTPVQFVAQQQPQVAPHFTNYIRQQLEQHYGPDVLYNGGLRVVTTIDLEWQAEAQRIVSEKMNDLRQRAVNNAGVVMLSPDNQILAMVGSVDFNDPTIDGQVNVTLAPRQPGSALKPIVYAAAIERGWTPSTIIWDVPTEFHTADGQVYKPNNYDDSWHGPQRLRMALSNSLNIPAVKAMEFVGVEPFVEQAHALGITTLNDPTRYGLALVLGAGEVRLLDLTNVYSTFSNAGRERDPVGILQVTNADGELLERATPQTGRQALGEHGEQISYLITDMLSDNVARQYMFGPGNVMELPDGRPAAVKTGTSNDWRDSWAVGYTPDVTIGVWVGNSDNSPMQEIAGVDGAGVIWRALMDDYHQGRAIRTFTVPTGISTATICASTGALAGGECKNQLQEHFVAGMEPKTSDVQLVTVKVGGDGSCLATDATPRDEVHDATFVKYPAQYHDWEASAGLPQPPTQPCAPAKPRPADPLIAQISAPAASTTITATQVFVYGSARGNYTLDYGAGRDPATWQTLTSGVNIANSLLGVWRTDGLPAGDYTLRLSVTADGVPLESRTIVQLRR